MDDIFLVPTEPLPEELEIDLSFDSIDPYDEVVEKVEDKELVKDLKRELRNRTQFRILTKKEGDVLYVIRMFQYKYGYTPSHVKVAEIVGTDCNYVSTLVRKLIKKGYLEMQKNGNFMRNTIKFPKHCIFPFWDGSQFPPEIFNPRRMHELNKHTLPKTII